MAVEPDWPTDGPPDSYSPASRRSKKSMAAEFSREGVKRAGGWGEEAARHRLYSNVTKAACHSLSCWYPTLAFATSCKGLCFAFTVQEELLCIKKTLI